MKKELTLDLGDDLLHALKVPLAEVPTRLRRELAVRLYDKELLSFGKARKLAEMTRWDFHDLLGEERILRRYDTEELEDDLAVLDALK